MPNVKEVYQQAVSEAKGFDVPSQDIRALLAYLQGYAEPIDVVIHGEDEIKDLKAFKEGFEKLKNNEPVEYVIHQADFLGQKLYVDERVLIPRQETMELVSKITEVISAYFDPRNYLVAADIGTGSGCIALALKRFFPNWLLSASDISKGALEVAKINFNNAGVNVNLLEGSALEPYIEAKMNLDIIVSNPPYILNHDEVQDSVKDFEPDSALYLDKEHSVYEAIFRDVKKVKKGALFMALEIGYDLKEYLEGLMKKYLVDYEYEFMEDLDERLRFLFVYLK